MTPNESFYSSSRHWDYSLRQKSAIFMNGFEDESMQLGEIHEEK